MKTKALKKINKPGNRAPPSPDFVKRAERAFKKVAMQVVAEHKRHGLKPLVWKSGLVRALPSSRPAVSPRPDG